MRLTQQERKLIQLIIDKGQPAKDSKGRLKLSVANAVRSLFNKGVIKVNEGNVLSLVDPDKAEKLLGSKGLN